MDDKHIRFIDSNYNHLFNLPDGDTLYLTYANGEKRESICKYIDEYHLEVGNSGVFHICQLAEIFEKNGTKYAPIPTPDNMPYRCYGIKEMNGDLVLLKYNQLGYFNCNYSTSSAELNRETLEFIHASLGITKAQAAAMYAGSLFGFHVLIANPDFYHTDGTVKAIQDHERSSTERMKELYPAGTRIVLDKIYDSYCNLTPGSKGIVQEVDDVGTVYCVWQNGSMIGVIPDVDLFHKDTEVELDESPELTDEVEQGEEL